MISLEQPSDYFLVSERFIGGATKRFERYFTLSEAIADASPGITVFSFNDRETYTAKAGVGVIFIKDYANNPSTEILSGIQRTINCNDNSIFHCELTDNTTFYFTNMVVSKWYTVVLSDTGNGYIPSFPDALFTTDDLDLGSGTTGIYSFIKIGSNVFGAVRQGYAISGSIGDALAMATPQKSFFTKVKEWFT